MDNPHGLACNGAGQTASVAVVAGVSPACENGFFACYVSDCGCGCRQTAVATVPGLAETCEQVLFANANHFPQAVTLHDGFVYWTVAGHCPLTFGDTGSGKLMAARSRDGAAAIAILGLPCPFGVAAIDDDLYWTNQPGSPGGSVWTARRNGDAVRVLTDGLIHPSTIRVDSKHVYWFDHDGIYRLSRDGGSPEQFAEVDYVDSQSVTVFELDESYVYWIDGGLIGDGHVFRAAKADGERESVATVGQPFELAISAQGLFWVEAVTYQAFALFMLRWGDQAPTRLASPTSRPHALAASGDEAYWVESEQYDLGAVYRARAGAGGSLLAGDQPGALAIAADDDYVFWANQNYADVVGHNGQIVRACR